MIGFDYRYRLDPPSEIVYRYILDDDVRDITARVPLPAGKYVATVWIESIYFDARGLLGGDVFRVVTGVAVRPRCLL